MAFDFYPSLQTAALSVPASTTSAAQTITTERIAAGAGFGGGDAMFIRFVMLNPLDPCNEPPVDHPTIHLSANGSPPVEVTLSPATASIFDGTTYIAGAFYTIESDGVYRVEVNFLAGQTGNSWTVEIENNAPFTREFTWVVGDSLAETSQPWLDISSTTSPAGELNYDTLIGAQILVGQVVNHTLQIANKGTGKLEISDAVGMFIGTDYEIISITLPVPLDPGPPSVPANIPPNTCGEMVIAFNAPAAAGQSIEIHNIGSSDSLALSNPASFHNRQVTLTGTSGKLELMMLLDTSGSMSWEPAGNTPPANPNESRWGRLKSAATASLTLLGDYGDGAGRFAVSMFPDITQADYATNGAPPISAADFFGPADIDATNTADAAASLDDFTPITHKGGTSMGQGIELVIGAAGPGHFEGTPEAVLYNRRWMVLMTDGEHNSGPPDPHDFYTTAEGGGSCVDVGFAAAGRSFADKGVRVITVAYGDDIGDHVDHATLSTLACKSNGLSLDAGINDLDPVDPLAKQIRGAVIEGLNLVVAADPVGTLTGAASEVRAQIHVTPYDSKVTFVVDWESYDENRLNVQLVSPLCDVITPKTAQVEPNIGYHSHPRFKIYTIGDDYLSNAANGGSSRYGVWTLIISGNDFSTEDREPYQYEVLMDSRLKLKVSFDKTVYFAGNPIEVSAITTLDGKRIPDLNVSLQLTTPGQSSINWLAQTAVTKGEYAESAKFFEGADITAVGIKSHAIKQKGLVFNNFKNTQTISMSDEEQQGVYKATISNTSVTGGYKFYVKVTGQIKEGIQFQRELQRQRRLAARPLPDFTIVDTIYAQFIEDDRIFFLADVIVWPRDPFGNVVLIDPDSNPVIELGAKGGEFTGPLVGNLDGSYTRQLRYPADSRPVIDLQVGGAQVIERYETAPLTNVSYADKLIDFNPGNEAAKGANQHTDPRAALGDFIATDSFVSLGAQGSITLGLTGEHFVAHGNDDITVFVHTDPDSDTRLRSYEVQALAPGKGGKWVTLGQSAGVTQSFGFRTAGLERAEAIRIVDKSGTVLDNFKASNAPGVSIMAVGFNKSGLVKPGGHGDDGPEGWLGCFLQLFRCLFGKHK